MRKLLPVLFIILFSTQVKAQTLRTPIPAFTFLILDTPDARHGGMGNAGVATSSDESDFYWNPSKTTFASKRFGFFIAPYNFINFQSIQKLTGDTYFRSMGGYYRLNERDAISANFNYTNQSILQTRDNSFSFIFRGNPFNNQMPIPQWTAGINFARKLNANLSLGLGVKYINAIYQDTSSYHVSTGFKNYTNSVQTYAFDISLYHKDLNFTKSITVDYGICISNIGRKINYDGSLQDQYMPTNLKIGIAPTLNFLQKHKVTLVIDANKLLVPTPPILDVNGNVLKGRDNRNLSAIEAMIGSLWDAPDGVNEELKEINWALGTEYWYNDLVAIRLGKTIESKYPWGRNYITMGVGTRIKKTLNIDVAYMMNQSGSSIIGDIIKASIGVSIGKIKNEYEQNK